MKKMKILLALSMPISFLAGCANSTPSDWQFKKDDMNDFIEVNSEILQTDNENEKILRITNAELLNEEIKDDDFMIFNYEKLIESEPADEYYSYQNFKSSSVKAIKKVVSADNSTIDVYFEGNDEEVYGAIFNKDATYDGGFLYTVPELNASNNNKEKDLDRFERELLESPNPKPDETGYIDVINHFGVLCSKIPQEGENEFLWGVFIGIVSLILAIINTVKGNIEKYGKLPPNFHYFNEIQNRLNLIDTKLNNISSQLTSGFSDLLLAADKEAVASCTRWIGSFKSGYLQPIGDFCRWIESRVYDTFKTHASGGSISMLQVKYANDPEGKLCRIGLLAPNEIKPDATSQGSIQFINAKKYLDTYGRVDEKFVENFGEDIFNSIKPKDGNFPLPPGITQENLTSDILLTIIEDSIKESFTDPLNKDKLESFRDLIINYTESLYETDMKVVDNYVKRCELSYNFGAEAERSLRNNLAYLLFDLERNTALTQMVCRVSGITESSELTAKYLLARNYIKEAYKSVKNLPSNLCFRDGQKWGTKLFEFRDNIAGGPYAKRKAFSHSLLTYEIVPSDKREGKRVEYDKNAHPWTSSIALKAATARYIAITNRSISMLDYFRQIPGLISQGSNRLIDAYVKWYSKENVVQFLGDFGNRNAANDVGRQIRCVARGDEPNHPKFRVGDDYIYKNVKDTKDICWYNATCYTADAIDAYGTFTSQKDLIFYCDYIETSKWWINDEIWSFNGRTRAGIEVFGLGIEVTQ